MNDPLTDSPTEPVTVPLIADPGLEPVGPGGPGLGCILVLRKDAAVPTPLASTAVEVTLDPFAERTRIVQTFRNEGRETCECVWVGALPFGAAIDELVLAVGDRTWRGRVERREEARAAYAEALGAGLRTALLELDGDDVGTLRLGTLRAGETATITIGCTRPLALRDGRVEVRVPLVLGTRFSAGGHAKEPTPNALPPGLRPATGLSVVVRLRGLEVSELAATQHATSTRFGDGELVVELARKDEIPNRDFVLRFVPGLRTAALRVAAGTADAGGRVAVALHLAPPPDAVPGLAARRPRDLVFLLDRSGSMAGRKMAAARRATKVALRTLEAMDRFAVLAFDDVVEGPAAEGHATTGLSPFSQEALDRADAFLDGVDARGGTEVGRALAAAAAALQPRDAGREPVIVLVTDGQVQGADAVLAGLGASPPRVLALGIDDASNEGALLRLAERSAGESRWVGPGEDVEAAIDELVGSLDVARLAAVRAEAVLEGGARVPLADLVRLPQALRPGTAVVAFGTAPAGVLSIEVSGTAPDGSRVAFAAPLQGAADAAPRVRSLWAAATLAFRAAAPDPVRAVELALANAILSRETALVLVGDRVAAGEPQRRVDVLVPSPSQWEMRAAMPCSAPASFAASACSEDAPPAPGGAAPARPARDGAARRGAEAAADPIRELLLTQRADGSFGDGSVAATQAAAARLLARRGAPPARLRQALAKARAFLAKALAASTGAERRGLERTLAELAAVLDA